MDVEGQIWFDDLRSFIAARRVERPITPRDRLDIEAEMQCRIIGGALIPWLERYGPRLIRQRGALSAVMGVEKDPFIVFTSTEPGLVAADLIVGENARVLYLYPDEYQTWLAQRPDERFRWHVHYRSYFREADASFDPALDDYPLAPGESYRIHTEGTMLGTSFGRTADHLWKWNGTEFTILMECFREAII